MVKNRKIRKPAARHNAVAKWCRNASLAAGIAFAATAAHAADTIRYGAASYSVITSQMLISSLEKDIFGRHDVDLQLVDFRGSSVNCLTALISDAVDVCQVGTTTGTDAIAEGADIRALAVVTGPINEIIVSSRLAEKVGIGEDAPVEERLKALKGARFATAPAGSAHYTTLNRMLEDVDLSIGDLQFQPLTDVTAMMESVRNDRLDAVMWSIGDLGGLLVDGTGVRWISIPRGDMPELNSLPYVTAYVRADWAARNPELAQRVHAGIADAIARIENEPASAAKAIHAEFFPDLDTAIWEDGFEQARKAAFSGATVTQAGWQQLLDLQHANTGKDYAPAAFDKVVLPIAQAK